MPSPPPTLHRTTPPAVAIPQPSPPAAADTPLVLRTAESPWPSRPQPPPQPASTPSVRGRSVYLRATPPPTTLSHTRQILRFLSTTYGALSSFRHLAHEAQPSRGILICVFVSAASAQALLAARRADVPLREGWLRLNAKVSGMDHGKWVRRQKYFGGFVGKGGSVGEELAKVLPAGREGLAEWSVRAKEVGWAERVRRGGGGGRAAVGGLRAVWEEGRRGIGNSDSARALILSLG
ncbi:MAG: hypothetical protein M1829_006290 [Trizodia sp. TS-e1964]|nr:MAG: hypothetical protein M1829_006290 [Trizodia sp. TS-e1964]